MVETKKEKKRKWTRNDWGVRKESGVDVGGYRILDCRVGQ